MADLFPAHPSPLVELQDPLLIEKGIRVWLKRDDLLHESWGGNKWRKLKYNLQFARQAGFTSLLTFGGAYSNHIAATAAAGREAGFKTIGFIRGEEVLPLNPTLSFAVSCGMELHYLSREEYRRKDNREFLAKLKTRFPDAYLIPEGGSNALAVKGCAELVQELPEGYDFLCAPVGTGATLAGLIAGAEGSGKLLGFAALKGADFLRKDIKRLLIDYGTGLHFNNWELITQYHFGGYAKVKPELLQFMEEFQMRHGIPLEPIYTGKMLYGIHDLIRKDYFPPESNIIAVHTGGMQGLAGLRERGIMKEGVS